MADGPEFLTTRWSVVRRASAPDEPASREALERLCESYWFPLYAYVRRTGVNDAEARDLVQGFFARLLEKLDFAAADPALGRFRAFILTSLKHFLANQRERERALKRGGGRAPLSLDYDRADSRFGLEPADEATPEDAIERTWALELIERVMGQVEADYTEKGKADLFEALRGTLVAGADEGSRAELAARLDLTEGALKVAVHRLRKRFGERLRAEIAHTVGGPEEVDREIRSLFSILGRSPGAGRAPGKGL